MPSTTPTTSEQPAARSIGEIVLDDRMNLVMRPARPGQDLSYFVTLQQVHLGSATRIRTDSGPDTWRFHFYTRRDVEVEAKFVYLAGSGGIRNFILYGTED